MRKSDMKVKERRGDFENGSKFDREKVEWWKRRSNKKGKKIIIKKE